MDEETLRRRIAEVAETLMLPPPSKSAAPPAGTYVSQVPPPSGGVEELLDHLRLQAKYVVFDLEATRRENRYLRQMLERRSNSGEGADPP